jgi:hypothetical protein
VLGNIIVQHGHRAPRNQAHVRCDVTAVVGFVLPSKYPEGKRSGDFIEVVVRGEREFSSYEFAGVFDPATKQAVNNFFRNGGDTLHVFAVCIEELVDLKTNLGIESVCEGLFHRLESEEDISIVLVPALAYFGLQMLSDGTILFEGEALMTRLLQHCAVMNNRFLILDAPQHLHDDLLIRWVNQISQRNEKFAAFGAMYYPWLCSGESTFPPSSVMAGLYVAVEKLHPPIGIQWPPANIAVRGCTHSSIELTNQEATDLARGHVNPIVLVPGKGLMPMGARTLSKDPIFQQINSRRIVNMIIEQIQRDTQWAVFEVNNPHLWTIVSRDVAGRLEEFWNLGLLELSQEGEKYFVMCNEQNNPRHSLDAGYINVEVRLQPVGTTEQILIDFTLGGG